MNRRNFLRSLANVTTVMLAIYVIAACTVFAMRHPWMTDTETFLHLGDLLTFQTVEKP